MGNIDLGKTKITDDIRVSSAAIFMSAHFGEYTQYETWVFSDDENQKTHQIIHGTNFGHTISGARKAETIKVHYYISQNLLKKFNVINV